MKGKSSGSWVSPKVWDVGQTRCWRLGGEFPAHIIGEERVAVQRDGRGSFFVCGKRAYFTLKKREENVCGCAQRDKFLGRMVGEEIFVRILWSGYRTASTYF